MKPAKIPRLLQNAAVELRQRMRETMAGSSVGVALDGWTNFRHSKTFNFVIIWNGQTAFFLELCPPPFFFFGKSAAVVSAATIGIIDNIEKELGVTVCSPIADNEKALKGMSKEMVQWTWSINRFNRFNRFNCFLLQVLRGYMIYDD